MPYSWEPTWLGIRVDLERLNDAPGDKIDARAWPKLVPDEGALITLNHRSAIPDDVLGVVARARLVGSRLTMILTNLQRPNALGLSRTVNYLGEGAICAPQLLWGLQAIDAERIPRTRYFLFTDVRRVRWTVTTVTQPWKQSWTRFRFGGWQHVGDDSRPSADVKYD